MRSAAVGGDTVVEDQTALARIRDAAILRFGREGFGVGLRAVAQDAGVSPALVLHHFGSKAGLRVECDAHVLSSIRLLKEESLADGSVNGVLMALASLDESAPLLGYALRSLQPGGDLAHDFVEHFVADAEEYRRVAVAAGAMVPSRAEVDRARYLTVQSFGALLLDFTIHPPDDPTDLGAMLHGYLTGWGCRPSSPTRRACPPTRRCSTPTCTSPGTGPTPGRPADHPVTRPRARPRSRS